MLDPGRVRELVPRLWVALAVGRTARRLSKITGRGRGNVVGGHIALGIEPRALHILAAGRPTVLVSGTNGKTTTTRFLARAAALAGPVVSNDDGANLPRGLVSVLMDRDIEPGARLVAEVDERWLSAVVEATRPEVVVLLNLSRDQLDRMEEVRSTASRWREGLSVDAAARTTVVANADDPIVVAAVPENAKTVWVGAGLRWRDDAATCPWCGQRIVWDSDDQWRCADCGRTRPTVNWQLDGAALHTAGGGRVDLVLAVPGRHNLANAAMAIAAAAQLGVDPADAARACATVENVAGRYQHAWGPAHRGRVYLAKNPAGWIETLDVLDADRRPVVLAFNSNGPDGRDPSWIYDVAFERLADRRVIVTGERATDLSVRLRYADVAHRVVMPLAAALAEGRDLDADVVASYTAFGEVRHELDDG